MDATLHWEAMHIQNPAAGGLPGQRSLLFCYRHGARVRKFGYFILSPDHHPFRPTARPHLLLPLPTSSASSPFLLRSHLLLHLHPPPPPRSRRTLRVLTPRRMSGVMNFNSFTPRHVGVVGEATGGRREGGWRVQARGRELVVGWRVVEKR